MEKRKLTLKDGLSSFIYGFLISQLSIIVLFMLGSFVCSILKIDPEIFQNFIQDKNHFGFLIAVLMIDTSLILFYILKTKNIENKIISKPNVKKLLLYIAITIISFFMIAPATISFNILLAKFGIYPVEINLNLKGFLLGILSLVILPAVGEEFLMRGLIFKGLKPYGKIFSIVISAFMFAIFHMSVTQLIFPICFGLLFGVIMHKEDNIIYTISMHATNNFLALIVSYFGVNLSFNHWSYYVLSVVLLAGFLVGVLYFTFKGHKREENEKLNKNQILMTIVTFVLMLILWIIFNMVG